MSDELETVKAVVTHPATGGGVIALLGWLANKVYRGVGHRIANVDNSQKLGFEATWKELDRRREGEVKLFDMIREHEQQDADRFDRMNNENRDRHDELLTVIGDLRADIAGLKK